MAEFGEWGTLSFELPDFLEDTKESINNIAEFLITFLDIALAALQLVKAFAIGFLDPLAALVQAVVDQIKALLDDLKNLGIYITGDWGLLEHPYEDLKGGFSNYERRMIARLTDRTDPTRPDVSQATEVFAGFFYLSVDASSIQRLVQFIRQILDMFNQNFNPSGTPPVPVVTGVQYGTEANSTVYQALENLTTLTPPEKVKITWKASPTTAKAPYNPFPQIGPQGFLVTVGVREEGIPLVFSRPENDASKKEIGGERRSKREYGKVLDREGQEIVLYGGADMLGPHIDVSAHDWNEVVEGPNQFHEGKTAIYGLKSPASGEVVSLANLSNNGVYFLQRTFPVEADQLAAWVREEYSFSFPIEELPHDAEFRVGPDGKVVVRDLGLVNTYYVRIASTDNLDATTRTALGQSGGYQWDFSKVDLLAGNVGKPFKLPFREQNALSAWSPAFKITVPGANTNTFIEAVSLALVILVLSRSDLPLLDEVVGMSPEGREFARAHRKLVPGVALLGTGLEPYKSLLNHVFPGGFKAFIEKKGQNPQEFRQELLQRTRSYAKDLCDQIGARPEIHQFVAQNTLEMRTATIRGILESGGELESLRAIDNAADEYSSNVTDFTLLRALSSETDDATFATEVENGIRFPTAGEIPPTLMGGWRGLGVAPNPYSMEVPEDLVENLFRIQGVIRGRKDDFIELDPAGIGAWEPQGTIPANEALGVLANAPPSLQLFYEKYIQEDGSILIPTNVLSYMTELAEQTRVVGSGDSSPVFYFGADRMRLVAKVSTETIPSDQYGAHFLRTLFRDYDEGVLYTQAALVLGIAASVATRSPQDGEWIAVRFLDTLPALDDLFENLQQWLDSLAEAFKSIADAIIKYISFVEDRIVELQNLIYRINALIQSILGFTVGIPQCSALLFSTQGIDGVVQKLVTAENKPSDSPLAYGGGIAMVAPLVPAFLVELFKLLDGSPEGNMPIGQPSPAFGLENLPAPANSAPDAEPDVL